MWTRRELKQRAKEALRRNYWKIVLVIALTTLLSGGLSVAGSAGGSSAGGNSQTREAAYADRTEQEEGEPAQDAAAADIQSGAAAESGSADEDAQEDWAVVFAISAVMFTGFFCIVFAVVYVMIALVLNPFSVGVSRFMLKSVDDRAQVKEIAYGFDHSYRNIVKTMFHSDMRVLAWSLLFLLPGIICRVYCYRLVPYILAEQPDVEWRDALRRSAEMMRGEKWRTFVLDLSFVMWRLLSLVTCGLAGLFYVDAYKNLTDAALYRRLCELRDDGAERIGEAVYDAV